LAAHRLGHPCTQAIGEVMTTLERIEKRLEDTGNCPECNSEILSILREELPLTVEDVDRIRQKAEEHDLPEDWSADNRWGWEEGLCFLADRIKETIAKQEERG
jgi:bacterioferritin-associated ferredoxin